MIVATKKIFESATDKHGKKGEASDHDNYLKNIIKKTLETLNGGNVTVGTSANTTASPGGSVLGMDGRNEKGSADA